MRILIVISILLLLTACSSTEDMRDCYGIYSGYECTEENYCVNKTLAAGCESPFKYDTLDECQAECNSNVLN